MINDQKLKDGLTSMATNLGQRQGQLHYQSAGDFTDNIVELEALWRESWICQKIINKKARDMTRKWREITSNDLSAEQLERIDALERKLKLKDMLEQACIWASLYGGVGILILTERNTIAPLQTGENIERLILIRKELISGQGILNTNLFDDNYGYFDNYLVNNKLTVHHSRLIILNAIPKPLKIGTDNDI